MRHNDAQDPVGVWSWAPEEEQELREDLSAVAKISSKSYMLLGVLLEPVRCKIEGGRIIDPSCQRTQSSANDFVRVPQLRATYDGKVKRKSSRSLQPDALFMRLYAKGGWCVYCISACATGATWQKIPRTFLPIFAFLAQKTVVAPMSLKLCRRTWRERFCSMLPDVFARPRSVGGGKSNRRGVLYILARRDLSPTSWTIFTEGKRSGKKKPQFI